MLFNSYEFCLLFLPVCLLVYRAVGRHAGRTFALTWLLLASVAFYAWSSVAALSILGTSVLLNYGLARWLARLRTKRDPRGGWLVGFAVAANLAILGQFKYLEFLVEAAAALVGIDMPLVRSIPPLAISFFTFQQIAYVVDVHRGHTAERNLLRYGLFVCFFPQLIAGPIVHHRDMLSQFAGPHTEADAKNLATGFTLFSMGLFKKAVIADGIVDWVTPVFASTAAAGLSAFDAWMGTLAYTLQLYFDFSGYCDMAIGLGLMFGFRLPVNFDSPYRAASIIDFWRRWHQTLSRFLRDYLYIGLGGNRRGKLRRYAHLMITMLLGGLWHGASWTFVVWGALHGLFLVLNHAWRGGFAYFDRSTPDGSGWRAVYRVTTLVSVMIAWVFFRADSFETAFDLISVMIGFGATPAAGLAREIALQPTPPLFDVSQVAVLAGLLGIVSFAPNSQQIVGYGGVRPVEGERVFGRHPFAAFPRWRPSVPWAAVTATLCLVSLACISEAREFVYFRF